MNATVDLTKGPNKIESVSDAIVLAYHHQHDGGNGYLPYGIAYCYLPSNTYTPFVIWQVAYREGLWHANIGHYCRTLDEAYADYKERCGEF